MIPDETINYKNTGYLDNDLLVQYLHKKDPLKLPKAERIVINGKNSWKYPTNTSVMSHSSKRPETDTLFMLWMFIVCSLPLIYKDI